jgi:hypothetical protein
VLIFDVFSGCFLDGFWNQKEKGRFVEMLVFTKVLFDVFRGYGHHLGCQKERNTEWESDLDSNFCLW